MKVLDRFQKKLRSLLLKKFFSSVSDEAEKESEEDDNVDYD